MEKLLIIWHSFICLISIWLAMWFGKCQIRWKWWHVSTRSWPHAPARSTHFAFWELMASQVIHSSKSQEPLPPTGFFMLAPLGGLTSAQDRERIERFCRKLERAVCVAEDSVDIDSLMEGADKGLLMAVVRNAEHVLRPHFPPVISIRSNLRPSVYPFCIVPCCGLSSWCH